jgi:hypothetical protein
MIKLITTTESIIVIVKEEIHRKKSLEITQKMNNGIRLIDEVGYTNFAPVMKSMHASARWSQ